MTIDEVDPRMIFTDENGAEHLRQEFEIPEGALPVRMQTGDLPVTIVGWVAGAEDLPQLLESLARELREMLGIDGGSD